MFDNIKPICSLISKAKGMGYKNALQKGSVGKDDIDADVEAILKKEDKILSIAKKYDIHAWHSPVRSGSEINGEHKEFYAFMQYFEINAPLLLDLANYLGQQFKFQVIKKRDGTISLNIASTGEGSRINTFASANYFITCEEFFGVDLSSKKLVQISGYNCAMASPTEKGWALGVNLEVPLSLDNLLHEIIHAKCPDEVKQSPHINIDLITDGICKKFSESGFNDLLNEPQLEEERIHAKAAFNKFDSALGKIK